MADVKNVITGGIGAAPGGLVWFFTTGLEAAAEVVYTGPAIVITVPYESRTMTVPLEDRTITVPPMGLA